MSMALDAASPIRRYEHDWHPWTRQQVADLSERVQCSDLLRVHLSISRMMAWFATPQGCVPALAVAGRMKEEEVEKLVPLKEMETLIDQLIMRFYGEAETEPIADEQDASADPLALRNGDLSTENSAMSSPA